MTARSPLVLGSDGLPQVLQAGDTLGANFSITQLIASAWQIDDSGPQVSIASSGGSVTFATGIGLVLVSDNSTNEVAAYLIANTSIILLGQTGTLFVTLAAGTSPLPASGKVGIGYSTTANAYVLVNNKASGADFFTILGVRMRATN